MAATQISVYFQAAKENPKYGDTDVVIPGADPDREEFFTACEEFFRGKNRPEDADKFHQTIAQARSFNAEAEAEDDSN